MEDELWPGLPRKQIRRQSEVAALLAFALVGLAIYGANRVLTWLLDADWSELILTMPAVLACLVISPAQERAERWLTERACRRFGGHTFVPNRHVPRLHCCTRCNASRLTDPAN